MATDTQHIRITREAKRALLMLTAARGQDQTTVASDAILQAWRKEAEKIAEEIKKEE
jgi:hypothetical protein